MKEKYFHYKCITLISALALLILIYCSSNLREFFVGITASLVAAYIFVFLLDVLPYYLDADKRKMEYAILYRDLQLFLTRIDDYFLVPYWVRNVKDSESKEHYDSWVKNTGLQLENIFSLDFYRDNIKNFDWKENYPDTSIICQEYFQIEWDDARGFAERILRILPLVHNNDIELAYLLQHITYNSSFSFVFRFTKRNIEFTKGFNLLTLYGENKFEKDVLIPMQRIHIVAWKIYEIIRQDSSLVGEIYEPRFYEKNNPKLKQ